MTDKHRLSGCCLLILALTWPVSLFADDKATGKEAEAKAQQQTETDTQTPASEDEADAGQSATEKENPAEQEEDFRPSEDISDDISVSFPVDI